MTAAELRRHGAKLLQRWTGSFGTLPAPWRGSGPLSLSAAPDIRPCLLQILGEPKQNRKLVAEVSLRNPLTEALSGCTFTVEGRA